MFGYVVTDRGELLVREWEAYRAVYCGLCKSLGRDFGFFSRLNLSYDLVFLALTGIALEEKNPEVQRGRCLVNPMKKCRYYTCSEPLRVAGYVSVLLTYHKLRDDLADERGFRRLRARLALLVFGRMRRRAAAEFPELDRAFSEGLTELTQREKGSHTPDSLADCFGRVLAPAFEAMSADGMEKRILSQLGYHMGRYIYMMDAADDLEEDRKLGRFNPLLEQCSSNVHQNTLDFMQEIRSNFLIGAQDTLAQMQAAFSLLDVRSHKGILENILYRGLPMRQRLVAQGKKPAKTKGREKHERSL